MRLIYDLLTLAIVAAGLAGMVQLMIAALAVVDPGRVPL